MGSRCNWDKIEMTEMKRNYPYDELLISVSRKTICKDCQLKIKIME